MSQVDNSQQQQELEEKEWEQFKTIAVAIRGGMKDVGKFSVGDLAVGLRYLKSHHIANHVPLNNEGVMDAEELNKGEFLKMLRHWGELSDLVYEPDVEAVLENSDLWREDFLTGEFLATLKRPAFMVVRDREYETIAFVVRGTWSVRDGLTDANAKATPFLNGHAHAGMLAAAQYLYDLHKDDLKEWMEENKGFKLVVCGHSLGGGVASLLSCLLKSEFPLHCYTYGSAACVSPELSKVTSLFITSVVNGFDIVPRSSLASIETLRAELKAFEWATLLKEDIANSKPGSIALGVHRMLQKQTAIVGNSLGNLRSKVQQRLRSNTNKEEEEEKEGEEEGEEEEEGTLLEAIKHSVELLEDEIPDNDHDGDAAIDEKVDAIKMSLDDGEEPSNTDSGELIRLGIAGECFHMVKIGEFCFVRKVDQSHFFEIEFSNSNASDHSMTTYKKRMRNVKKYLTKDGIFEFMEEEKN